ncbi:cell division protein FtsZ [Psychromarinibacter halotolerans]|uniref:Cell division protein FtsZ n=1 Tax=Psychromarinibacter halotolerans TaxID=1775175 RepID=A0ABV7GN10_9RHOB|nr:cell division protein FtsZ [Psychromarinibacter halotolerans]MDF0596730.1 cell division protein FtsZ [Psychromarinibacter halotolerans]
MTLNLQMPEREDLKPRITVFGVGGAGGNAVNNMIEKELEGVEFVVANTDAQALSQSRAASRVQIGVKVTEGLGAGARPSVGAAAAEETIEEIVDHLAGAHMCFITAGMGGGTGTGAAPIIAQAARELGVLTVGVVTKPFQFEGAKRMRQAEDGVENLQKMVDTLIIIPNQNLFRLANEKTTFTEAFSMADDVLYQGVKGVTDLMVRPGLINLDFADVRAVMDEMGKAMMGTGEAEGEDRAIQAAEKAIANPLLDEISLRGARGVLINITGGHDLTLFELDEAANRIREEVDAEANIIVGSTLEDQMEGRMRVSVVATGIDASENVADIPVPRRRLSEPLATPEEVDEKFEAGFPQAQKIAAADQHVPAAASEPKVASFEPEQPSFKGMETKAAKNDTASLFDDGDDLPPPAYQPEPVAAAPAAVEDEQYFDDPQPETFVAPKSSAPSPEMLTRLQNAVKNSPRARPQAVVAQQPAAAEQPTEKPRFGINSLIGRMTGHSGEAATAAKPQPSVRRQPPVTAPEEEMELDPEQERIEIPAFLRRQAN